jgi:Hydantoinase/oxoprolinase N-terminal region
MARAGAKRRAWFGPAGAVRRQPSCRHNKVNTGAQGPHKQTMGRHIASKANGSRLRLAVDIGGTFTDIAAFDEGTGKLTFGKALSSDVASRSAGAPMVARRTGRVLCLRFAIHVSALSSRLPMSRSGSGQRAFSARWRS